MEMEFRCQFINMGESVIWIFFAWCIFTKWWPFFIMSMPIFYFCQHSEKERQKLLGGGVSNLIFFNMMHFYEMVAIFQFWWIVLFLLTLRELETQTLKGGEGWRSVIWNFSVRSIFTKWQPFFNCFIMADSDIPFLSTLGKTETQTLGGGGLIIRNGGHFFNFS